MGKSQDTFTQFVDGTAHVIGNGLRYARVELDTSRVSVARDDLTGHRYREGTRSDRPRPRGRDGNGRSLDTQGPHHETDPVSPARGGDPEMEGIPQPIRHRHRQDLQSATCGEHAERMAVDRS